VGRLASPTVLDVLLEVVLPVLLVAAVGGWVGHRLGFSTDTFSKAVFHLFSPCLVFLSIADIELEAGDIGRLVVVAVVVFFANAVVAGLWGGLRRRDPATNATNVLTASVVNQGNMGLPMATLAFGDAGLQVAVLIFVTGVVLWSSAGIALGSLASGAGSRRRAMTAPFRYPSIYATALGALVNVTDVDLPVFVRETTHTLGQASIPCMLVILGLQFHLPGRSDLADPLATSVNRLVIGPLVAWPVTVALGLRGVAADTSIMMAGMPTAVMTTILAAELGGRPQLAVRTVIITTLVSIPTLTVLIAWLR
jgi:predicted permease